MVRFIVWLVPAVEKFPRSQKFLLGDRIQSTALDVLERLSDRRSKAGRTMPHAVIPAKAGIQDSRGGRETGRDWKHGPNEEADPAWRHPHPYIAGFPLSRE